MIISPSLLAADFLELENEIKKINASDAEWIHLDIMDGNFVDTISFGPMIIKQISKATNKVLDVHLMVTNPTKYLDDLIEAKVNYITIHSEILEGFNYIDFIKKCHQNNIKVGIAINPGTDVQKIKKKITYFDLALIMSVEPGKGGQKFISSTLIKVEQLRKIKKEILIEIDGGISDKTIKEVKKTSIDIIVSGSFLFKGNFEENLKKLY